MEIDELKAIADTVKAYTPDLIKLSRKKKSEQVQLTFQLKNERFYKTESIVKRRFFFWRKIVTTFAYEISADEYLDFMNETDED
jgi:hypothetical protein